MTNASLPQIEVVDGLISDVQSSIATIMRPPIAPSLIASLRKAGLLEIREPLPELADGEYLLLSSHGTRPFDAVLLVGSNELRLGYDSLQRYGVRLIEGVAREMPSAERISLIAHGQGYGLDFMIAFEHLVEGIEQGLRQFSSRMARLERVMIVEINKHRANHFRETLEERRLRQFASGASRAGREGGLRDSVRGRRDEGEDEAQGAAGSSRRRTAAEKSVADLTRDWTKGPVNCDVFVAMPFADEYADLYELGIYEPAHECGLVCERTDKVKFVGDIARFMFDRIERAKLVVAEVSEPNANVYLEVGYAWGKGIPVLFIAKDPEKMKFDIRNHRCLPYKRITELKRNLRQEFESIVDVIRGRA